MSALRDLHPPCEDPCPDGPDRQIVAIDLEELKLVIKRKIARGAAAGPSGWTGELLLPLIRDKSCLEGLGALVLDISNNLLDAHSRQLLTSCLLLAIPKPGSDVPRPLAIGEVFLKTAASYCTSLTRTTLKISSEIYNLLLVRLEDLNALSTRHRLVLR